MIKAICIVILVVWGLSYSQRLFAQMKFKRMNVTEFDKAVTDSDVQLLDVRTPKEFAEGHIPNAVNLDVLDVSNFKAQVQKLNTEKPIYVYCRSGVRSLTALRVLKKKGFDVAYDLKGGYTAWLNEK